MISQNQDLMIMFEIIFIGKEYYFNTETNESQWEHPKTTSNKSSRGRNGGNNDQVQVLHILVKHTGSRNPKNYKGETITRSKDEARKKLDGLFLWRMRA